VFGGDGSKTAFEYDRGFEKKWNRVLVSGLTGDGSVFCLLCGLMFSIFLFHRSGCSPHRMTFGGVEVSCGQASAREVPCTLIAVLRFMWL